MSNRNIKTTGLRIHINRLGCARKLWTSKYTAANVTIASGGSLMLSRLFAALGEVNLGYQVPDYTAYEDMMAYHQHRFTPIVVPALEEDGFVISASRLEREVVSRNLDAFVLSNPCNPTGCLVHGGELKKYVEIARDHRMTLVLDEFYSHFIYEPDGSPGDGPVSGAAFVEMLTEIPCC